MGEIISRKKAGLYIIAALVISSFTFLKLHQENTNVSAKPPETGQGGNNASNNPSSNRPTQAASQNLPPGLEQKAERALLKPQGNKLNVTYLSETGEELGTSEIPENEEFEVEEEDENSEDTTTVHSEKNAAVVIRNKIAAQTHFPLMVNLETNELIVTTPKGQKVVTVLPDQAVQNMLAANVLDQIGGKGGLLWLAQQTPVPSESPEATPSGTPIETATPSASPTSSPSATFSPEPSPTSSPEPVIVEEGILLTTSPSGVLVYEIQGVKHEKLLSLFRVGLKRVVVVSAETGELLEIRQNFPTKVLDFFSL